MSDLLSVLPVLPQDTKLKTRLPNLWIAVFPPPDTKNRKYFRNVMLQRTPKFWNVSTPIRAFLAGCWNFLSEVRSHWFIMYTAVVWSVGIWRVRRAYRRWRSPRATENFPQRFRKPAEEEEEPKEDTHLPIPTNPHQIRIRKSYFLFAVEGTPCGEAVDADSTRLLCKPHKKEQRAVEYKRREEAKKRKRKPKPKSKVSKPSKAKRRKMWVISCCRDFLIRCTCLQLI